MMGGSRVVLMAALAVALTADMMVDVSASKVVDKMAVLKVA